jgi:nitroreductase
MELSKVIKKRRSIRRFAEKMPEMEKIRECIEAACYAPSSHNSQPWKFFIVTDKKKIEMLSKTQTYCSFLKNAPMVIVATADEKLSPSHFIEDCTCAVMILMLKAAELGLGTCWGAVYSPKDQKREDHVRNVLNVPKNYRVICNIGIGYPDQRPGKKNVKSFERATEVV